MDDTNANLIEQLKALRTKNEEIEAEKSTITTLFHKTNTLLRMQEQENEAISTRYENYKKESELKLKQAARREKAKTLENEKLKYKLREATLRLQNGCSCTARGSRWDWFPRDEPNTSKRKENAKASKPQQEQGRGIASASGRAGATVYAGLASTTAAAIDTQVNDEVLLAEEAQENPNLNVSRDSGHCSPSSSQPSSSVHSYI
ncbi:unnamed protein product [Orchesella dallaii]|uniref:Uncharacterized protein n=1 Tax=Orchesella dallaii TaxID=48710 RepID=A0ABP1RMY3_9HEXA